MVAAKWALADAQQHFFIYIERTNSADLLDALRQVHVSHAELQRLASTAHANFRATALAATAPYFTAMMGGHTGRSAAVQQLMDVAAVKLDPNALRSAHMLLENSAAFIEESFETLRLLHTRHFVPEVFQALMRQATAMCWGVFEAFAFEALRLVFTNDLAFLRRASAAEGTGVPWGDTPTKLLNRLESKSTATPSMSYADAFDTFKKLPTMTLRACRHFCSLLLPVDISLLALLDVPEMLRLSARRHLLMHSAGVIDQQYVTDSSENLAIGSELTVDPRELALEFRAASRAGAALTQAVAAAL